MEFRPIRYGLVDSTNERALHAIAAGTARQGDVHVAAGQTAGRGRRGRPWASAPHEGVYLSVVLRPARMPADGVLSMAGGLAALDVAAGAGVRGCELSWPNDLELDGAKLAGVLVETRGLDPTAPALVLGIGFNVRQTEFPEEELGARTATSLLLAGADVAVADAEAGLLEALGRRVRTALDEPQSIATDFFASAKLAGEVVAVETGEGTVEGRWVGIDLLGGLTLDTDGAVATRHVPLAHARTVRPV